MCVHYFKIRSTNSYFDVTFRGIYSLYQNKSVLLYNFRNGVNMNGLAKTWIILLGFVLLSCNSKQRADEAWVDSVLQAIDSIPDEQLDFTLDEVPIDNAVDGNFNDFIYTFLRNRQLQLERVEWPVKVIDTEGKVVKTLRNRTEFRKALFPSSQDYFVMLLNDVSQMEEDAGSTSDEAYVHFVDFDNLSVERCSFLRKDGLWTLNDVFEQSFNEHPLSGFLSFYHQFAVDSIYQIDHVAQPLTVSIPDENDEMGMIDGTIDADQFPLFSPELPLGVVMFVDYGQLVKKSERIVMVKCGMANGMMDILTFDQEDGEWKLVGLEE